LTPIGPAVPTGSNSSHGIAFDPQGRFLVVLTTGDNSARVFAVNPVDGTITPVQGPYPGGGRWVAFTPAGDRVLLADNNLGLWSFLFDKSSGALAAAPGAPFAVASPSLWFVVTDPSGQLAYAADRTRVLGFHIDSLDGSLTPLVDPLPSVTPLAMGMITTTW
jgi:DNA-binding beta-propeller fold protein YncE